MRISRRYGRAHRCGRRIRASAPQVGGEGGGVATGIVGRLARVLALLFWSACGGEAPVPEEPGEGLAEQRASPEDRSVDPESPATQGEQDAQAPTTLVFALRRLPAGLDPLGDLGPWGRRIADDLVFEGLVRRNPAQAPWVDMALADRCVADRQIVDCHLRPGVRFHDGVAVTPDDVLYSISYWLDPRRSWIRQRHGLVNLRSVELVDGPRGGGDRDPGQWVRIAFEKSEPLALELLAAIKIVPKKKHRGRAAQFGREPVGTGPMRVTTLDSDRVMLERLSAEEWDRTDRSAPPVDRILFRALNDGAEALTLLRRGQIHVLPEMAANHVPVELGKPGMAARFEAWIRSPPRYDVLLWNVGQGLMKNDALRHAMHTAVPRAAIEDKAHGAPGLALDAPVDLEDPRSIDLFELVDASEEDAGMGGLPTPRDPLLDVQAQVAARGLLDGLGWKLERGIRSKPEGNLRVTIMWDGASGAGSVSAREVREAWRSIGAQAPYATAPWGYLLSLIKKGSFQVALVTLATRDDADLYDQFHSRGELNLAGVRDRGLDAALEEYRRASTRAERNRAEMHVAQRLAELRVATVLYAPAPIMLASARVTGMSFVDDLPVLDRLGLRPARESEDWAGR